MPCTKIRNLLMIHEAPVICIMSALHALFFHFFKFFHFFFICSLLVGIHSLIASVSQQNRKWTLSGFFVTGITASNVVTRPYFFNDLQCLRSACNNFSTYTIFYFLFYSSDNDGECERNKSWINKQL